ncbi:DinB family protein [Galactobacter caseinivorans]|uniref:DUF664 domain-containing protein n=1 Tax=Galactobacter caseinivorans TaxID=2676123 RepID=A0A496PK04_9MICC|nr:DinB family protein [Galactobacter caseinivorans]RKW70806.1 DUF664 domain-containing protein [Galactobacter caseinivorans]
MTNSPVDLKALLFDRYRQERATLWHKAGLDPAAAGTATLTPGSPHMPAQTSAQTSPQTPALAEHLQRAPMTPTGTNLLGLVKHVALVEAGYFGDCFGRPFPDPPAYFDATNPAFEPDDDLWAFADESPEQVLALALRAAEHADTTIRANALEAMGHVPWWGESGRDASLAELLVHMLDEVARHLGHADIVRELVDGEAGYRPGNSNLPEHRTPQEWAKRHAKLAAVAQNARLDAGH